MQNITKKNKLKPLISYQQETVGGYFFIGVPCILYF